MTSQDTFTIGELARRSGLPVKTIRFYSDIGVLAPAGRSEAGYRLYDASHEARLATIRSLREAGLDLETIRAVLERDRRLVAVLEDRLGAVEADIAGLERVAAALRGALAGGADPDPGELARLHATARASDADRAALVRGFYDEVAEGLPVDKSWLKSMRENSLPELPARPSPAQLDAWLELAEILLDPAFLANMRAGAEWFWPQAKPGAREADVGAGWQAAREQMGLAAASREDPDGPAGARAVEAIVAHLADALGRPADAQLRAEIRERFTSHDPRGARFWELLAILRGDPLPDPGYQADNDWLQRAFATHGSGGLAP